MANTNMHYRQLRAIQRRCNIYVKLGDVLDMQRNPYMTKDWHRMTQLYKKHIDNYLTSLD